MCLLLFSVRPRVCQREHLQRVGRRGETGQDDSAGARDMDGNRLRSETTSLASPWGKAATDATR